jgi:PIN domain nuclease of toxin-antitoxin system
VCAFRLFDLPTHHAGPFDRQLIAQALAEDIAVVTLDEAFLTYEGLKVVW